MLNEKGQLIDTPAIKLLLRVFELDLTGILYLKKDDILKVLYFNRGKLIWAISNSPEDKLENVLISLNMTTPEALSHPELDLNASNTAGKALVEHGIITLEELIEASRYQLKKIIDSVLTWQEGSFQFVKDTPPERLLSLDLKITDFVVKYIIEILDLKRVWEEIGSLHIKLKVTDSEARIRKFNLTERQSQLLRAFNGDVTLEHVLSSYDGAHRNSLLKIIFFFIMANLVDKPQIDYSQQDTAKTTPPVEKNSPTFEEPVKRQEEPPVSSFVFDGQQEEDSYAASDEQLESDVEALISDSMEKKGNMKWFLFIAALLIVASILFFLQPEDSKPFTNLTTQPETKEKKTAEPVMKNEVVEEKSLASEGKKPVSSEKKPEPAQVKPEPSVKKKAPEQKRSSAKKSPENIKRENSSPRGFLEKGKLVIAGDLWKKQFKKKPWRYGVLLELACQKTSITKAFKEIHNKDNFYILNIRRGNRICFLVMYGRFSSVNQADVALKSIPQYFWKQNPPKTVEIKKYIK